MLTMVRQDRVPSMTGQLRMWILEPKDIFLVIDSPEGDVCTILEGEGTRTYNKSAIVYQSNIISDMRKNP